MVIVALFLITSAFLLAQTIYFSPALDLVLTVYSPFFEMRPSRPNEIGLFQVPGKSSTLQVVSISASGFNDLNSFAKLLGAQLIGAEELAVMNFWLGSQEFFYRRFSISSQKSEGIQMIFLRSGKGYILTYYSSFEEFWQHLVPALLTMTSLRISEKPQVYLNTDHNYTVKLMGPFVAVTPARGEIGAFATHVEGKRGYVQIVKENLPRKISLEEYSNLVERNTLMKLAGYKLFSTGVNYVEGIDYAWRIFEFERTNEKYRCIQAYTIVETVAYTITYIAKEQDFDFFLPAAVYIAFSFKPIW